MTIQFSFKMQCRDFTHNSFYLTSSECGYFQTKTSLETVVMGADSVVITHKYPPKRHIFMIFTMKGNFTALTFPRSFYEQGENFVTVTLFDIHVFFIFTEILNIQPHKGIK